MRAPRNAITSTAMAAYKIGRVIRLKADELESYIEGARIKPGTLEHLYPDAARNG
jgi:hypothetical protein